MLAREGDAGFPRAFSLLEASIEGDLVLHGVLDALAHHHRPRLASKLFFGDDRVVEVIDHDFGLLMDCMVVAPDIIAELLVGSTHVELGVLLDFLRQPAITVHRRVVFQHVHDEALLDGLFHGVTVEGAERTIGLAHAEEFEGLVLGSGGEGEVAGVGKHLPRLHDADDFVFGGLFLLFLAMFGEGHLHFGRGASALAGVRFVNNDGELLSAVLTADFVEDEGEGLNGGNDDLLAVTEKLGELGGLGGRFTFLDRTDGGGNLGKLLDGVANLLIEDTAVGDDNDGIKDGLLGGCMRGMGRMGRMLQTYELVGKPGDGVAFAAAGGVLDQVAFPRAARLRV